MSRTKAKGSQTTNRQPPATDAKQKPDEWEQKLLDAKHVPTAKTRESVAICRMARMTDEELALSFNISVERLRQCYDSELVQGAATMRRRLVEQIYQRAMNGSPAAVKILETMCTVALPGKLNPRDVVDAMSANKKGAHKGQQAESTKSTAHGSGDAGSVVPPVRKGKKEIANEAAQTAQDGTAWGEVLPRGKGAQLQ